MMKRSLLLALLVFPVACIGCSVTTTSTVTEEISLCGPSLDGHGKVLDPSLRLTVMRSTPCRVVLHDSKGKQLYAWNVAPVKSVFTIAVERGNLVIKQASGQTVFKTPVAATADTVLNQESDLNKLHQGKSLQFCFRVGKSPNGPAFDITVSPRGNK